MPDKHPLQPGDPAELGQYRLLGRLGKGAQGIVYKAQGPDGELVAIKLLNTRLDKPGIDAERFMREVAAARRVAQFCTAQVLGANMDGELPYIVSELVEGVSLQRVVQTDGPARAGPSTGWPWGRSPHWPPSTAQASCTATSSRATCCWAPTAPA
ncbi:protein kinase domain-containing protein [Nonomuraea recticatena]|uniref:protein kinase domain-containing protein n=1 Tax=Nonomuraea recticatena TaxID=46178 RepID=UPI00360CA246